MKKKTMKSIAKIAAICLSFSMLLSFLFAAVLIALAPSVNDIDLSPDGYRTSILDDNDKIVRTVAGVEANRVYVNLEQIPEETQEAFIAIEDERFYEHHGVDIKGVGRAVFKGITTGSFSQGGSTITQQLLKNNVFKGWTSEDSFFKKATRKVQEMYLALMVERKYDKQEILENYLNTINLGKGSWGVEAASYLYFDKDVSDLSLAESSLLAGITKNPSAYNPIDHPEKAKERQELVLTSMEEQGYITAEEHEKVEDKLDDLYAKVEKNYKSNNASSAYSYFEDALLEQVKADLMEQYGYTSDEAWEQIYRGGLTIHSTQHTSFQNICEDVAENGDYFPDDEQVSIVMMDTSSGAVKAIIGGRGQKEESLSLNRATSSERQPGSTIKIIGEYAAGIDTGAITLGTTYDDAVMTYSNGKSLKNSGDEYAGQITVSQAIADSKNTVAVKCFQQVGSSTVVKYLEKFGITTLSSSKEGESLALGGTYGGVTNLQLTAAYNAIANGGVYTKPYYYDEVVDHDGNVILKTEPVQSKAVSSETATLLTTAMEDVLTVGTGTSANFDGMSLAGKSGTTSDMKDLWFVGFSPYYSCGVWGGYDDGSAQNSSTYVKKIWKAVMQKTHSNYKNKNFSGTDNLVSATICTKCGKLAVSGLCDSTLQGDMTKTMYFSKSTVPTAECDCHVAMNKCTVSGMLAGTYCPSDCITSAVYLKKGTAGTADEDYVAPTNGESCTTHTNFIDKWFGDDGDNTDQGGDNPDSDSGSSWWNSWGSGGSDNSGEDNSGGNSSGGTDGSSNNTGGNNSGNDNYDGSNGWSKWWN